MAILTHRNAHHLLTIFVLIAVLQAQDQQGFISIDCGLPEASGNYSDPKTELLYMSDSGFIHTGISKSIATMYQTENVDQQLVNLRSFPQGRRNCYEIQLSKGTDYLIRAVFMYGNHDSKNKAPVFDLHIGSKKWETIRTIHPAMIITKEIIHFTTSGHLDICLVNTGFGEPFISTLELRPLKNNTYDTDYGSLDRVDRFDIGSATNQAVRFPDDPYDRIWEPYHHSRCRDMRTEETIDPRNQVLIKFLLPNIVMTTASTPANPDEPLDLLVYMEDITRNLNMIYMHFAEIVKLPDNESRVFNISLNGQPFLTRPLKLDYLSTTSVYGIIFTERKIDFSLYKVENSTLPPLLNAIEIFYILDLTQTLTHQEDVEAVKDIRKWYGKKQNWQGDPCTPQEYRWDGVNCSYSEDDEPRIILLNLSAMGLTGKIPASISSLTSLQSLDLSNNNFTGPIPDFLSKLTSLKILNLSRNKLRGSVPASLIEKSKQKTLELSVGGNPDLCASNSCKRKKSKVVPIVASIAGVIVVAAALATSIYFLIMRKQTPVTSQGLSPNTTEEGQGSSEFEALESKGRCFTYSEVVSMTNNFQRVLGKGGFGTVYHGYLGVSEVAVKMLSTSCAQGYKEFQNEVRLLLRIHHRNLTSLVGFCDDDTRRGLIYEYMANGDIEHLLSGPNKNSFKWDMRLQVVVQAAQGLEYLHNGCNPPVVHRDIKPANILLSDKFEAKLADFGLSRSFPIEGASHISTVIAGTPGYLDPEYSMTNWLTEKSDIYSFGIVLLKIITGRPVIATKDGSNVHIYQWVKSLLENGDIHNIVDQALGNDFNVSSVWKAVEIAMECASPSSDGRPLMHKVLTELNQCLDEEIARKKQTDSMSSISDEITRNSATFSSC